METIEYCSVLGWPSEMAQEGAVANVWCLYWGPRWVLCVASKAVGLKRGLQVPMEYLPQEVEVDVAAMATL